MHDRPIWKTAPPLWRDGLAGTVELDRPAILRFDGDDFVERLQSELDDPEREVGAFILQPETWRQPAAGRSPVSAGEVPRLYQPIHGRFYLVTGGLVCERYGLPDKVVHPDRDESVFAVLRRLEPTGPGPVDPGQRATYREFGWVPEGQGGRWISVAVGVAEREQRLPAFPMTYVNGHRRRVLAAMIPVAARERYEAALPEDPIVSSDPAAVLALPGRARLETVVLGFEAAADLAASHTMTTGSEATRDLLRETLFFAMVDLSAFLVDELEDVWEQRVTAPAGALANLAELLAQSAFGTTWTAALHRAYANRNLVMANLPHPPAPVTNASLADMTSAVQQLGVVTGRPTVEDPLFTTVAAALDAVATQAAGPVSAGGRSAAQTPPDDVPESSPGPRRTAGAVYAVRFVYERPRCPLNLRLTVSQPTRAFRLSHIYDPDAPYRDSRIVLPVDTSLEGLRKYPKAVRMEVSAQLRKQMERIQGIKMQDLDNGTIPPEPSLDLGMVCSLSIPIITICALVLLMIIVSLLNIVFFWLPLFKICLPKGS
jgi:hypothetical protein